MTTKPTHVTLRTGQTRRLVTRPGSAHVLTPAELKARKQALTLSTLKKKIQKYKGLGRYSKQIEKEVAQLKIMFQNCKDHAARLKQSMATMHTLLESEQDNRAKLQTEVQAQTRDANQASHLIHTLAAHLQRAEQTLAKCDTHLRTCQHDLNACRSSIRRRSTRRPVGRTAYQPRRYSATHTTTPSRTTAWQRFLKQHCGEGKNIQQLSRLYHRCSAK